MTQEATTATATMDHGALLDAQDTLSHQQDDYTSVFNLIEDVKGTICECMSDLQEQKTGEDRGMHAFMSMQTIANELYKVGIMPAGYNGKCPKPRGRGKDPRKDKRK